MTMEDVWNDISFASLCAAGSSSSATRNDPSAVHGFISQDFMASTSSTKLATSSVAAAPLAPPSAPPPATLLSLSSSGSDHFQQYQVGLKSCATTSTNTSAAPPIIPQVNSKLNHDSTNRPSSSSLICFANKSGLEGMDSNPCGKRSAVDEENGENSSHVRHKRMIKNRESASRSRARKQAYTSELELKLELLKEENARLKMQQKNVFLLFLIRFFFSLIVW